MYRFPLPNKIMMKKYARKVLAATMAVSMMVPMMGMNVFAADANTTKGTTNVKYDVQESYTWSVPAEIDFTKNATVTTSGESGNTQNVCVTKNVIPETKKLHIVVSSSNNFTSASKEGKILNYTVKVGDSTKALSAGGTVLDVKAGTNKDSAVLKFELTKDDTERAGNYTGIVAYESSVVAQ